MLKSISNLGAVLTKTEQQTVYGGIVSKMPLPCPDGSPRVYHPKLGWFCRAVGTELKF